MALQPKSVVLFRLAPQNNKAREIIQDPRNSSFIDNKGQIEVSTKSIDGHGNIMYFSATPNDSPPRSTIIIGGEQFTGRQFSFFVNRVSKAIMVRDDSNDESTQVCGPYKFRQPRQLVVSRGLNTMIQIGGPKRDLVCFKLIWRRSLTQTIATIDDWIMREKKNGRPHHHDSYLRAIENEFRERANVQDFHPNMPELSDIRCHDLRENYIGTGGFGDVDKVIDIDSGTLMARKNVRRVLYPTDPNQLPREIDVLSRAKHEGIVQCHGYKPSRQDGTMEIFMSLKEGSIVDLVRIFCSSFGLDRVGSQQEINGTITNKLLTAMLSALAFLERNGIVHRDVKPANILYTTRNGEYHFELADFGLCNTANNATTRAGTDPFMAPEVYDRQGHQGKADVWSLFVTMMWLTNVDNFRDKYTRMSYPQICQAVQEARNSELLKPYAAMAYANPQDRSSATDILRLATSQHQL